MQRFYKFSCYCVSMWFKANQNILPNFFLSSISLIHLTLIDRKTQISPALIILKDYVLEKVLQVFCSWDKEIDSWFTNHEPLIPTQSWFLSSRVSFFYCSNTSAMYLDCFCFCSSSTNWDYVWKRFMKKLQNKQIAKI